MIGVAVGVGLLALVVTAALLVGDFFGDGFTSHIDRANEYLEAVRGDEAAAAAMRCQGAEDPNAGYLARASGHYLSGFEVTSGAGEVAGTIDLPDGVQRQIIVLTSGPTLPTGDDPSAEVCIVGTEVR